MNDLIWGQCIINLKLRLGTAWMKNFQRFKRAKFQSHDYFRAGFLLGAKEAVKQNNAIDRLTKKFEKMDKHR